MNDTITLELRDLKKHEVIVNMLRVQKSGFTKYDGKGVTLDHEILMPEMSRKAKEKFTYRVLNVASSHYKIIIVVNHHNDCILFNFSIPKYFYGHNIAQAIQNPNEPRFNFMMKSWDDIKELGYERLMTYINTFFDNEFPTVNVEEALIYLKLKRLDFCYNQIFRSKNDAIEYLELQKTIKKKHLREQNQMAQQMYQVYATSIFYSNQDYSVKIYHKGSEYQKNDKAEHERINKIKDRTVFDTNYLQEISDRILRYEITIRPSYMSYLYNNYIFRRNSKQFATWKATYNKIKNIYARYEKKKFFETVDVNKEIELLLPDLKKKVDKHTDLNFVQLMQYIYAKRVESKISNSVSISLIKRFYRDFDSLIHTRRNFWFKVSHEQKKLLIQDNENNSNRFQTVEDVLFTDRMYQLLAGKLKEFIIDMRIDAKQPISHYLDAIDKHNEKAKRIKKAQRGVPKYAKSKTFENTELDKPRMTMLLLVLQNNTIDTLSKMSGMANSTKQKYISDLKKIGYTKNTLDNLHIQVPALDFNQYYHELMTNQYRFFTDQLQVLKFRK